MNEPRRALWALLPCVLSVLLSSCVDGDPSSGAATLARARGLAASDPTFASRLAPGASSLIDRDGALLSPAGARTGLSARLGRRADEPFAVTAVDVPAHRVLLELAGARPSTPQIVDGAAVYPGVLPSTDAVVVANASYVEAFYLLADERAPVRWSWRIAEGSSLAAREATGTIELVDSNGTPRMRIEAPGAIDAAGARHAVTAHLEGDEVVFALDLRGGARPAYPVLVDPIVYVLDWVRAHPGYPRARAYHALAYDVARGRAVMFGGHPGGGFDPASDTWEWDGAAWHDASVPGSPIAREGHSLAYDATRGRVVLFGGRIGGGFTPTSDTWEWDGSTWTRRTPSVSPPPRHGHVLVYDAARSRIVLFGGQDGAGGVLSDTWEWDGTTWANVTPAVSPTARWNHALAWDAARGRTVLFGGRDGAGTPLGDTWQWDGATWTNSTPAGSPVARHNHALAYDSARGRVVLFGGADIGWVTLYDDTWEWDGTAWTPRAPATTPGGHAGHALTFDSARARTLLLGPSRAWEWDGTDWAEVTPSTSPAARSHTPIAYDATRARTVLFSGSDGAGGMHADTWEWDGTTWTDVTPASTPPPRAQHALAFDSVRDRVVLFAGATGGTYHTDTWEWDGTVWTDVSPATGPTGRREHALAFDAARGRVVLFGGYRHPVGVLGDTWEWDGSSWTDVSPATGPSARSGAALTYDAARARVVLFGGFDTALRADTWEWDGTSWTDVSPVTSPSGRFSHGMAYDASRSRVVLFGGNPGAALSDTWEWDGTGWSPRMPGSRPSGRDGFGMTYDSARGRIVLFGGVDATLSALSDTWELVVGMERDEGSDCDSDAQCASGSCVAGVCAGIDGGPADGGLADGATAWDSGVDLDGGPLADGAVTIDAGGLADAGTSGSDAGALGDAGGIGIDAAALRDAEATSDAGTVDGDSGAIRRVDAGRIPDRGDGCGCSAPGRGDAAVPSAALVALVLVAGARLSRRR